MTTSTSFPSENPWKNTFQKLNRLRLPSILFVACLTRMQSVFCEGNEPKMVVTVLYQHYTSTGPLESNREWRNPWQKREKKDTHAHTHCSETRSVVISNIIDLWRKLLPHNRYFMPERLLRFVIHKLCHVTIQHILNSAKQLFFYTARRAAFHKNYLHCYGKEIATGSQKIIWAMPERHLWTKIISSTISKWPHKQIWSRFGIKGLLKQTMTTFRMLHYTAIWL